MDTVDIIGLSIPVTYFLFLLTEKLWPARAFPPRKGWQWIGILFLIIISTISVVVPLLIPAAVARRAPLARWNASRRRRRHHRRLRA